MAGSSKVGATPGGREVASWIERVVALSLACDRTQVRSFEGKTREELLATLCPAVLHSLDTSITLLKDLSMGIASNEPEPRRSTIPPGFLGKEQATRRFDRQLDALVKDARGDAADIAFIALGELSHKRALVARLSNDADAWQIVAECGSALRRVRKSLAAIEQALAGPNSVLSFTTVVETSLAVRREYVALCRVIQVAEPRNEDEARTSLRSVGTRIAMLIGRPVYPDLRVPDRVEIRSLQLRILDWLRDPPDLQSARRLLQDLRGFASMIAHVSRREELVAHDRRLVRELLASLPADEAPLPSEVARRLRDVDGLDTELDALLRVEAPCDAVRAALERLTPRPVDVISRA